MTFVYPTRLENESNRGTDCCTWVRVVFISDPSFVYSFIVQSIFVIKAGKTFINFGGRLNIKISTLKLCLVSRSKRRKQIKVSTE